MDHASDDAAMELSIGRTRRPSDVSSATEVDEYNKSSCLGNCKISNRMQETKVVCDTYLEILFVARKA